MAYSEQDRHRINRLAFLWAPVALGFGIAGYFALTIEPTMAQALAPLCLCLALLIGWKRPGTWARIVLVGFVMLALGFTAAKFRTDNLTGPILTERVGPTTVRGQVKAVEPLPNGLRITVKDPRISGVAAYDSPQAVRLKLQGEQPDVRPGDWVSVRAIVSPPSPPAAPGAFDFQRHAFFHGLGGLGFSLGPADILKRPALVGEAGVMTRIAAFRHDIGEKVRALLPGKVGAVAAALMNGEKRAIDEGTLEAMRDAGLAHLLAISGLHVGLVAGVVFFSARFLLAAIPALVLRYPVKKWAAALALLAAIFYCLMAGATIPTVRAVIMAGLVLFAVMLDRQAITLRLVAWAALIILCLQPEALLSASFQMSFAAVTALVAVYEGIRRARQNEETFRPKPPWALRPFYYLGGVALTTLIASAATGIIAAYHFNRFAEFGLLANLLAVPLTALWVMPWAVLSFLMMPLGLEALPLKMMGLGVAGVLQVAEFVAGLPGAVRLLPAMPDATLVLATMGGLVLCLLRGRKRLSGLAIGLLGFAIIPLFPTPNLLVDNRGGLAAVKMEEGSLVFATPRGRNFIKEVWLRRHGQAEALYAKTAGLEETLEAGLLNPVNGSEKASPTLRCDELGCLAVVKGLHVAIVKHAASLPEDCQTADLVISSEPIRITCNRPFLVLDRFDFWRDGAQALWIDDKGHITRRSVREDRGERPWVPKRPGV